MDIYRHIPEFLSRHKLAALCIVIDTEGSAPRKAGSKMLVAPGGDILGTIGGGAVEERIIEEAQKVIQSGKPVKIYYRLEEDLGMQCGGNVEVYIDPLGLRSRLYIFGAGHVGKALAGLAHRFGFEITLLDFRPIEFSEEEKQIARFIEGDYFETLQTLEFDQDTYITIMSPTHEHDFELLKQMGKKNFAYLGMIGSKKKVARAKEQLLGEGHFTPEEFGRFDTPMGLPMAAETPEEIAISILGKIIDVRNKKQNP